jgi:hypothetical protein
MRGDMPTSTFVLRILIRGVCILALLPLTPCSHEKPATLQSAVLQIRHLQEVIHADPSGDFAELFHDAIETMRATAELTTRTINHDSQETIPQSASRFQVRAAFYNSQSSGTATPGAGYHPGWFSFSTCYQSPTLDLDTPPPIIT